MASRTALYLFLCCLIASSLAQSVTVEFEETSYSIYEGEGEVVFQINATFQAAFTGPELVRISGFPAPHEPSMDFNITESGIQTLPYPVVNDNLLDEDQMFNVTLESPNFMVMIGSSNTASVIIDEDDSVTIGFEQTMYTVYEGVDVEVCVNVTTGGLASGRIVMVSLSTDDVVGSGGGLVNPDYAPVMMELAFSDSTIRNCLNITTVFNGDTNATSFNVNLTTMEAPSAVTLNPAVTTVNILDVIAPTIVMQPEDVLDSFPGRDVSFTVVAEGGALSYQWSRDGVEIPGATQATLTLVDVNVERNEGVYSCVISNSAGTVTTNSVSLTILRRPTITALEVPTGSLLNREVTITCTSAINASITLTVVDGSGMNLPLAVVDTTSSSRSVNVTVMNTGQHNVTCVADNNGLTEMKTALLYGITIEVADVTAGITANAVFFCNVTGATGSDNVQYSWIQTQNGVLPVDTFPSMIFGRDRVQGLGTDTLTIRNIAGLEQNYDYRCTVSISDMVIGSATGALTSPGPMIVVGPEDQELRAREKLVLNCVGVNNEDATMPLRINWLFTSFDVNVRQVLYTIDDSEVSEIRLDDNITVNSSFVIESVMPDEDGVYRCLVFNRNEAAAAEDNATVNIFFTPELEFAASPNPVVEGRTPLLTCTITAVPSANFSEILRVRADGTEESVANMSNSMGSREFVVTYPFANVRSPRDNGTVFRCRATNVNGDAQADVSITVEARPDAIDHENDVTAQLLSFNNVTITWRIPESNNVDITSYRIVICVGQPPNDTDCSSPSLNNSFLLDQLTSAGEGRLSFVYNELSIGKVYEVVIRAINRIGEQESPMVGNGFTFNSAFPDDGQVENVAFIPTTRTVIVTWELPLLARQTSALNVTFNVTYFDNGAPNMPMTRMVERDEELTVQVATLDLQRADSAMHTVEITAIYRVPSFVGTLFSLPGVSTLSILEPLLPDARIMNQSPQVENELIVSWTAPPNQNFLTGYDVFYNTSLVRSRRQTMTVTVGAGETSTSMVPFMPFTTYTVGVNATYDPPDGDMVSVSLLPSTTFQTPQRPSSPPLNVMAMNESVIKIRLRWEAPTTRNGIITGYRILASSNVEADFDGNIEDADTTTYLSKVLKPNGLYSFRVAAVNGFGNGDFSPNVTYRANFSVFPPVISGTAVGSSGSPQFMITTDAFSDVYGGLSNFKVVVIRGSRIEPRNIPDDRLFPSGLSQFNYYVAYFGDASLRLRTGTTITIGNGDMTNDGSTTFTNPPPVVGDEYYVFIRLYSSIDPTLFVDSELTGVLRIATPLDPAVIIAPIAVIAVVLLIILIVLLVVVFLCTRPRRGYTIAATGEDGIHRKKRGGGIELRRTRLFSPVVNVPVPDVFTSAGQPTTLVCEASGTPAPEVVWTQNKEPLDKERFIQLADSSLFINDTDLKDEGAYIITATNSAGTAEQMVRITVIRPSPPEPDPEHPPIQVGEFTEKIALLRANDDEGLEDEYSEVEPDITFTSYAAKININKNKNRYINIIPYDHSRVVLSLQDNTPGSDYVNASYVDGFNRPNAYIATQGPQPSTFPDFWRMVWEFDCPTIVMVTNLKEEDKLKCHQYWPNYGTTTYGNIQVTLKGVENLAEYSIRTFHITPIAGQSRVQMPVREVKQFHFLVWPDHGVPQFATPLLSFRKRVAKYHPDKKGPMVVHCSAGVGRTGTFITIDTMLRQMESEGVIDIFNFVRHMRFRRNYMVQTAPQYVFIHDALLEAIMCGDNSIPAPELRKRFQDLMEVDPESSKSRLQLQFENLNSNSPQDDDFDSTIAGLPDNMAKNRFKVHLPANDFRVPLGAPPPRSEGGDDDDDEDEKEKEKEEPDYICASFADGYRQRNAFIITQAPMSNTTGDFWKMIWEQKSAAIVMLTELEEDGKEMSVKYWPGEVAEASLFGSFQLELSEDEKDKGDYVTRKFKLSHVDAPQDCRIVTQFHFTKWPRSSTPKSPQSVIDLIDEIQRVQRKSGNQPITIHCDDGVSRTGAFCTLYSVLERVKVDQVVDVYLATKTLRIQRAGLLETLDQYIFVHKAVIEFLDSFSDYQNFK